MLGCMSLFSTNSNGKNSEVFEIKVPNQTKLLVLSPVKIIDSARFVGSMASEQIQIDYLMGNEAVLVFPDITESKEWSDDLTVQIHKPIMMVESSNLKYTLYNNYHEYFQKYGYSLFHTTALMGGFSLLFFLSLIVGVITRISGLFAFNLTVGYALVVSYIQIEQNSILSIFNHSGLAAFLFWLLFLVLILHRKYFKSLDLPIWMPKYLEMRYILILALIFLVSALFELNKNARVFELVLLSLLFLIFSARTLREIKELQFSFRFLFLTGSMLLLLQWLVFYFPFDTTFILTVNTCLLLFFTVFAYFISEAILLELKRNEELNKENSGLELSLGKVQISSIEKEREKTAKELHSDVVVRVQELAHNLDKKELDFQWIEMESTQTLNALREYSYSLYPPYLENLSLGDILRREVEKLHFVRPASFHLDYSLKITNHRIFKLWVYRIFHEYLKINKLDSECIGMQLKVMHQGNKGVHLEISHEHVKNKIESSEENTREQLLTYIRYMDADFSVFYTLNSSGWRFKLNFQDNSEIGDSNH